MTYKPMAENPGCVQWIDDAAKEIACSFYLQQPDIAEIIQRHWERHMANAVPADLAKTLDEAQDAMRFAEMVLVMCRREMINIRQRYTQAMRPLVTEDYVRHEVNHCIACCTAALAKLGSKETL